MTSYRALGIFRFFVTSQSILEKDVRYQPITIRVRFSVSAALISQRQRRPEVVQRTHMRSVVIVLWLPL